MNYRVAKRLGKIALLLTSQSHRYAQQPSSANTSLFTNDFASLERNGKRDARVHDPSTIVNVQRRVLALSPPARA
jgi:hypothetical protein